MTTFFVLCAGLLAAGVVLTVAITHPIKEPIPCREGYVAMSARPSGTACVPGYYQEYEK